MLFSYILKKGKILSITFAHVPKCLSTSIFSYSGCRLSLFKLSTESFFKLSSGLFNIFLIATVADNYMLKVGSFAIEIRFQNKWLVPILKFKEFTLYNIITTKATLTAFCCFESWFICWKVWRTWKPFQVRWLHFTIN